MSHSINIDTNIQVVFVKSIGDFDMSTDNTVFEDILKHQDYVPGMNILRDFSEQPIPAETSFRNLNRLRIDRLNKTDQKLGPCKIAIVVANAASYAKAHQFIVTGRLKVNPVERKLFRKIAVARDWLGIPKDYQIEYTNWDQFP